MSQSADAENRINSMGREPPENAMRASVHLHVNEIDGQRKKKRGREGGKRAREREGGQGGERERDNGT